MSRNKKNHPTVKYSDGVPEFKANWHAYLSEKYEQSLYILPDILSILRKLDACKY